MNIYSHVLPVVEREAAERMNQALATPIAVTVAVNDATGKISGSRTAGQGARSEGLEPPTF
jgi:hypothetical protein